MAVCPSSNCLRLAWRAPAAAAAASSSGPPCPPGLAALKHLAASSYLPSPYRALAHAPHPSESPARRAAAGNRASASSCIPLFDSPTASARAAASDSLRALALSSSSRLRRSLRSAPWPLRPPPPPAALRLRAPAASAAARLSASALSLSMRPASFFLLAPASAFASLTLSASAAALFDSLFRDRAFFRCAAASSYLRASPRPPRMYEARPA